MLKKRNRNWLFLPVVAIGILILFIALNSQPDIPTKPALSKARIVDVMAFTQRPFAPEIIAFGRVSPKRSWQGIAEVNGKVIYRNPLLEKGQQLEAGTLLLKIDPTDYEIAVAKAQADISANSAKLAKLTLDDSSIRRRLSIERSKLTLRENELKRQKNLFKKSLTSQSALDNEQQAFLAQQATVQELESQLDLLPSEKSIAKAEQKAAELALLQAERNLEKTQIILPFASRISSVNIEQDQVVTNNLIMVEAHGLGAVEVEAQVSIHDLQQLFASFSSPATINFADKLQDIHARVTLSSGGFSQSWQAVVTRLSDTVDAEQATVGVLLDIALDAEQQQGIAAAPSLVNGMFVAVQIIGIAQTHWVVPERALHGDKLYFMQNNALRILPVTPLFRRDGQVAVSGDFLALSDNPVLVLNDLIPAIEGMALQAATPVMTSTRTPETTPAVTSAAIGSDEVGQ